VIKCSVEPGEWGCVEMRDPAWGFTPCKDRTDFYRRVTPNGWMNVGMENGEQMWGWQMESGCRGNRQMDRGSQRVGGHQCDFFDNSWV
jgi:hypothetical protein